jgi:hypothetical protein
MWNFALISAWQVSSAPKHDEFFAADNRSIAHSLVREASQNSGDASLDGAPVELRFRFLKVAGVALRRELEGLVPHLNAIASHAPALRTALPRLDAETVPVLLVEDFGTTGLTGPYDNPRGPGNFNSFWRRFGLSEKGEAKGGRHGVGKSTVASASAIKTVFGVTVRYDDKKRLLYGQATLRPHELPERDELWDSYGVFASNTPPDSPLPFENGPVDAFADTFGMTRGEKPGLSLMIPLPVEELTHEALVTAAIEHCFHQILEGRLTVVVDDVRVDAVTLADLAEQRTGLANLSAAIALSRSVLTTPMFNAASAQDRKERLDESEFDAAALKDMRERWLAGETVGVKLHVPGIRPRADKREEVGEAWLFVKKLQDHAKAIETYIRGRLLVPERRVTGRDCLALMIARDGPLSTMLGDSEQPSHTRWIQVKLKEGYLAPEFPFRRARQALHDLERLLVGAKEGEALPDLLKPYFFTPSFGKPGSAPGLDKQSPPPPTPPILDIRRIDGGFVAEHSKEAEGSIFVARVAVRYLVRKGQPRFHPSDFNLDSKDIVMDVEEGNATISIAAEEGIVMLRDIAPGFRLRVTGFDRNRDLYVRAQPLSGNIEEEDEA